MGTYRLRLTANETGRGTRSAAAAGPRSTDEITLRAVPKIPPVGVPIDTAAGPIGQGVRLGAQLNQRFIAPDRNLPVQLVVLDRTDLSQVENDSYGGDDNSLADLANYLQGLDPLEPRDPHDAVVVALAHDRRRQHSPDQPQHRRVGDRRVPDPSSIATADGCQAGGICTSWW